MTITEIGWSPDDGGYWISQTDLDTRKDRASVRVYPSRQEAEKAVAESKVRWERWR
jgi:hypothetical protein